MLPGRRNRPDVDARPVPGRIGDDEDDLPGAPRHREDERARERAAPERKRSADAAAGRARGKADPRRRFVDRLPREAAAADARGYGRRSSVDVDPDPGQTARGAVPGEVHGGHDGPVEAGGAPAGPPEERVPTVALGPERVAAPADGHGDRRDLRDPEADARGVAEPV